MLNFTILHYIKLKAAQQTLPVGYFICGLILIVFIRECINKFGIYLFCVGCSPCDALLPGKCEMSNACNNTGSLIGQRVSRHNECSQYRLGANLFSQLNSVYCTSRGIDGTGLFDDGYGKIHGCIINCYWSNFFSNYCNTGKIEFGNCLSFDDFKQLFVDFSLRMLQIANENVLRLSYLNSVEIVDNVEEDIYLPPYDTIAETEKTYILLTEGITDKLHIELAWSKLYSSDAPFEVFNMNGVKNLEMFLKSYPASMFKNKILIGLFDYDDSGLRAYEKFDGQNNKNEQTFIKKIMTKNNDSDDKEYFVIVLPNDNEQIINFKNGTIEMLYSSEVLHKFGVIKKRDFNVINQLDFVKRNHKLVLNAKDYENINTVDLQYFEPKEKEKTTFCESLYNEEKEIFDGFKKLFSIINSIIKQETY